MPLGEEVGNTLLVKVDGRPLPDDVAPLLVNGVVDDSTNVPDLFVLRFNDENGTVLTKAGFTIGAAVELSVQSTAPGGPDPLLSGEVTALEVEVTHAGTHTVVRGLDKSHRLFRGTRVEAYLNMTASDIVTKVAQRAGLQAKVDATSSQLPHVTQDGVSDWDFLRRLASENDRVLGVVTGRLEFAVRTRAGEAPSAQGGSRSNPLVLERGVNLVALRATVTSNGQVPEVEVRGWDPAQKRAVSAKKSATTTSAQLEGVTPAQLASTFASPPYVVGVARLSDQPTCTGAAASLADHLAGGFAELEGTARGNPALRAGTAVQLTGVGPPFAGKYTLSGTRHDFSQELGYTTSFVVSNTSERSLYGTANGAGRRNRPRLGAVPAVVTSIKDPENLGRVKVKLPWLSETYESWWARPVLPGAGDKRGLTILPEVGDEVLVAFGHDDLEMPFVLGGLYDGRDKPDQAWADHVDANDGSAKRRAWVSRTGMVVEFLESSSDQSLQVSTNSGRQRITLLQTKKGIEIVSEGAVQVTAKQGVTVQAQQDVQVTSSGGNITMKGMNVSVEATSALELKGLNVKVDAQVGAELAGSATTTIRGGMVRIN